MLAGLVIFTILMGVYHLNIFGVKQMGDKERGNVFWGITGIVVIMWWIINGFPY